jgi:protein ImuA
MTARARTTPISLDDLHADVWPAHALSHTAQPVRTTGDAALDAELPGGGWPVGALTEILQPPGVHSEWRLLLPALAQGGVGSVVLVAPPQAPFAPALAALGLVPQRLLWVKAHDAAARMWTSEQALRCADVAAVLAWLPLARSDQLRRLQMAAATYGKLLFVMRPEAAQNEASPATLRLLVRPSPARLADRLQVSLLKRRGPPLVQSLQLPARSARLTLLLASAQAHALDCPPSRS